MSEITIPRPSSGDIITLLLDDHRWMESLLRDLRVGMHDRDETRAALSASLVAHSEAEEQTVYGRFASAADEVGADEVQHGKEEHAEGTTALLDLLECKKTTTQKFDDAVEKLSAYLHHHIAEEEITVLGPAARDVPEQRRHEIGAAWLTARSALLDADCGTLDNVRELVDAAREEGLVEGELPDQPQE
ncbi:hypothetical protein KEM60_01257 [Austwickia sp. TVS 96-490-7B]|uniref:hemerythrin domain-containing protein n=1 Tax=Austwickia sp. TVS 96-490-7B TaxID=2830843 RepID=UPI001C5846BE|nr:hemerythrin domain-containing protein [Austwickia sp. TVS 96-490-7B]MBW3085065.1 hypothetical protein [Austwickia sp. TVS 96-490-7B]